MLGLRCLALTILSAVLAGPVVGAQAATGTPPNILLVIADDMGLDASPCYALGSAKPDMPVLEAMCREGLVFDNVWAEPVCSPTRATILTGRYGFRTGVLVVSGRNQPGIGVDEYSLHRLIDDRAPTPYAHAVIGKWHLSDAANGGAENPERMGVGYYAGLIAGALRDYFHVPLTTDGTTTEVSGYATTVFTDIAIDWLDRQTSPWFLWLAHVAPHPPFHLPPTELHDRTLADDLAAIRADPLPYYLASLEALDHEIGRLLESLDAEARANTLVIFLGDNGTPNQVAQSPYSRRTAKGTLYPGGIRVPMVVSGAGVTRQGEREPALVNTTDLYATIAALVGIDTVAAEDSISFAPLLSQAGTGPRRLLYADVDGGRGNRQTAGGWTISDGRYQLLELDRGRYLLDIVDDPGGRADLLANPTADTEAILARLLAEATALRGSQ